MKLQNIFLEEDGMFGCFPLEDFVSFMDLCLAVEEGDLKSMAVQASREYPVIWKFFPN